MDYLNFGFTLGILVVIVILLAHFKSSFRDWFYDDQFGGSFLSDIYDILRRDDVGLFELGVSVIGFIFLWLVLIAIFLAISTILGGILIPLFLVGLSIASLIKWSRNFKK